jgi:phosphoglycerate dehydrogenase-like enzyme
LSFIIASQFEEEINDAVRRHASAPTVIPLPDAEGWNAAAHADVLLVRPTPQWRDLIGSARPALWPGRVRWIYSGSVGVDRYPRWLLDAPLVSCGRGVASEEIADYVIAALYAQAKNQDAVRVHAPEQWRFRTTGRVRGSTVGIVGLGAIGAAVAERCLALGARVIATRRRALPSAVAGVELVPDLSAVVAVADHLVLSLPATDATHHLIDAALLAKAKPGVHIVNIARGSVIDQDALIAALDSGQVGFATLDVTDPEPLPAGHPLWTHAKVRLTPHISSNYQAVRHVLVAKILDGLDRLARGERPGELVDPEQGY